MHSMSFYDMHKILQLFGILSHIKFVEEAEIFEKWFSVLILIFGNFTQPEVIKTSLSTF